jgi:hypothetical protein
MTDEVKNIDEAKEEKMKLVRAEVFVKAGKAFEGLRMIDAFDVSANLFLHCMKQMYESDYSLELKDQLIDQFSVALYQKVSDIRDPEKESNISNP